MQFFVDPSKFYWIIYQLKQHIEIHDLLQVSWNFDRIFMGKLYQQNSLFFVTHVVIKHIDVDSFFQELHVTKEY